MGFRVRFEPLFEVIIRHGFHLNGQMSNGRVEFDALPPEIRRRRLSQFNLWDDLRLTIPEDTKQTLSGMGCVLAKTRVGFKVGTEVKESKAPFTPVRAPDRAFRIRVILETTSQQFGIFTNIRPDRSRSTTYFLSNRTGESVKEGNRTFRYLSRRENDYVADKSYFAGDIVRKDDQGTPTTYLSDQDGKHSEPSDASPWIKLLHANYLSDSDNLPVFEFATLADPKVSSIKFTALDPPSYERVFPAKSFHEIVGAVSPGRYGLETQTIDNVTSTRQAYVDPGLLGKNTFAVLEIFHIPGDSLGEFRLYDESANHSLKQPTFMVRLLNRHTFWRYHFNVPPDANGGDLDSKFVTKKAMPLTRGMQKIHNGNSAKLLPNPTTDQVFPEENRIFSDVHVHVTLKRELP